MSTAQQIIAAASALPSAERADIIAALWDSMPPEDWPRPNAAWMEEVQRRTRALDSGEDRCVGWESARAAARREVGLDG